MLVATLRRRPLRPAVVYHSATFAAISRRSVSATTVGAPSSTVVAPAAMSSPAVPESVESVAASTPAPATPAAALSMASVVQQSIGLPSSFGSTGPSRREAGITAAALRRAAAAAAEAALPPFVARPDQRMLILVAFPGAGKSYFSNRLIASTDEQNRVVAAAVASPVESAAAASSESLPQMVSPLVSPPPAVSASASASTSSPAAPSLSRNVSLVSPPAPPRVWVRVNQDLLGSRKACIAAAERAIKSGHSVIIDRTNIDAEQRSTWVKLARKFSMRQYESVYLKIPLAVCKQRVLERVGHETLPPTAASLSIVERFQSDFVPPFPQEGFTRMHTLEYTRDEDAQDQKMSAIVRACNS